MMAAARGRVGNGMAGWFTAWAGCVHALRMAASVAISPSARWLSADAIARHSRIEDGSRISIHAIASCDQKPLCNVKQMLLFVSVSSGKLPCLLAWERYPIFASDVVGDHTVRVR